MSQPHCPGATEIVSERESFSYTFLSNELDPHRVRFWRVTINTTCLSLQPVHENDAPAVAEVPWHDLHDLLTVRPQLLEELDELEEEARGLRRDCAALRAAWRRMKRIVSDREAAVGEAGVLSREEFLARRRS